MAQETKDLVQQMIGRLNELPGGEQVLHGFNTLRDRLDEVQKRVRGLDAIEARLDRLEKRVNEMAKEQKPKAAAGPKTPKRATAGAKRTGAAVKRSSSRSSESRSE